MTDSTTTHPDAPVTTGDAQWAARLDVLEAKLDALNDKLSTLATPTPPDGLAPIVEALDTAARRAPVFADAAGRMLGQVMGRLEERGVDLADLYDEGTSLALDAADPEALALLRRLLEKKVLLKMLLETADQLESALADSGTDLDSFAHSMVGLTAKLAVLADSPEFRAFGESGVFEPTALAVVGDAGKAMVETRSEPIRPLGFFGVLRTLGDPDVKRAVGFTLRIAKRFGQLLG